MHKHSLYHLAQTDYRPELARVNLGGFRPELLDLSQICPMVPDLPNAALEASLSDAIVFFLALNAINYQFWEIRGSYAPQLDRYAFEGVVGAMGMERAMGKAWGSEASSEHFQAALVQEGVEGLFGNIPNPQSRLHMLSDIFSSRHFDDSQCPTALEQAQHVLMARMQEDRRLDTSDAAFLAVLFPQAYGGDRYLKRAQLALNFIANAARQLHGIPVQLDVTLFADYQVPRVARALGFLEYGPELTTLVDTGALLMANGRHERAIRAATVLMGRELVRAIERQTGLIVEEADLDIWLWLQRNACGDALFHRTLTTAY